MHVRSSPLDSVSISPSLMAMAFWGPAAAWQLKQNNGEATLSTATLNATVSLATGAVTFTDKKGNVILAEPTGGSASFVPVQADGQAFYAVRQAFASPAVEGLYGLG